MLFKFNLIRKYVIVFRNFFAFVSIFEYLLIHISASIVVNMLPVIFIHIFCGIHHDKLI